MVILVGDRVAGGLAGFIDRPHRLTAEGPGHDHVLDHPDRGVDSEQPLDCAPDGTDQLPPRGLLTSRFEPARHGLNKHLLQKLLLAVPGLPLGLKLSVRHGTPQGREGRRDLRVSVDQMNRLLGQDLREMLRGSDVGQVQVDHGLTVGRHHGASSPRITAGHQGIRVRDDPYEPGDLRELGLHERLGLLGREDPRDLAVGRRVPGDVLEGGSERDSVLIRHLLGGFGEPLLELLRLYGLPGLRVQARLVGARYQQGPEGRDVLRTEPEAPV